MLVRALIPLGSGSRVERSDPETKTLPKSSSEALLMVGSVVSAGAMLRRGKKEFGLGRSSFKRLENVSGVGGGGSSSSLCFPVIIHAAAKRKINRPLGTVQPIPDI